MTISSTLGYPDDSLEPRVIPSRMPEVSSILGQLAALDQTLAQAVGDSMAVKVGDLQVNYNAHIAQLKAEGSRLLRLLSVLVDLPIHYDKYRGTGKGANPFSVVSYW